MMKSLLFALVLYFVELNAFQVDSVERIEGQIKTIDFDSNYNCYIVTESKEDVHFYKLNDEKEMTFSQDFKCIKRLLVNSKNDVYIFESSGDKVILWILRHNTNNSTKLSTFDCYHPDMLNAFMDNDDNVFFNTKYGAIFIKSGQNIPLSITNLYDYKFNSYAVDGKGHVYLDVSTVIKGLYGEVFPTRMVVKISKESKKRAVPSAWVLPHDIFNDKNIITDSVATNGDGDVYFSTRSKSSIATFTVANITKLKNDFTHLLLSQYDTYYCFFYSTKDRLYFHSYKSENHFQILFVGSDDKVTAIEEIFYDPDYPRTFNRTMCASDRNGNVFFAYDKTILSIKKGETDVTKLTTPSDEKITWISIDSNDDLWVLAKNLYHFKSGDENAVLVTELTNEDSPPVAENKKTGEMYVGSGKELMIIKTDA